MVTCETCGLQAKSKNSLNSSRHLNSKRHLDAIQSGRNEIKSDTIKYSASIKLLERRVEALEQQNSIIMKKLNALQSTEIMGPLVQLDLVEIEKVKYILLKRLEVDTTINIDTLSIIFVDYSWTSVERAIVDLANDSLVKLEEGDSQLKINGKYAFINKF